MLHRQNTLFMIRQCCLFKADVVSKDEKENGLREILNFGHTIGHAIETIFDFKMLHGECVALGMLAVLELAVKQGTITQYQLEQIRELLHYFDLPLFVSDVSKEKIYQQMFLDKKVNQNKIRFVLPKRIGEVYTTSELSEHDIIKAIEFVQRKYRDLDPIFVKNAIIYVSNDGQSWIEAGRKENCEQNLKK